MSKGIELGRMFGVKSETRGRQSNTQIDTYWQHLDIGKEYIELMDATPAKHGSGRAARIADQLSIKNNKSPGTIKRCRTMYNQCKHVFDRFDVSANDDLSGGVK